MLWDSYVRDCQKIAASNTYYRESGRFLLTAVGKLNTYSLFAETFSALLATDGRAGFIVPSGIGTDDTNKRFFQYLVDNKRLVSFLGFDNARRIFPAVHPDTPFALVTIGESDGNPLTQENGLLQLALALGRLFAEKSPDPAAVTPFTINVQCDKWDLINDPNLTGRLSLEIEPGPMDAVGDPRYRAPEWCQKKFSWMYAMRSF